MTIVFFRTIILYIIIMISIRIMGKRQVGELEPSELVITIMISELAALPMQDTGASILTGLIPIITLLCLEFIMSFCLLKSRKLRALFQGKPSILIHNGSIIQYSLSKNRMSADELLEELRLQGYTDICKIKYAILETSGRLSVLPYASEKPPVASEMGIERPENGLPVILISDGQILQENIMLKKTSQKEIESVLKKKGNLRVKDIFLLTSDENNNIFLAQKED